MRCSRNSYTSHSGIPISGSLPNRHKFHEEVKSTPKKSRKQKPLLKPQSTTTTTKKPNTSNEHFTPHKSTFPFEEFLFHNSTSNNIAFSRLFGGHENVSF
jgi:hypothetical protein